MPYTLEVKYEESPAGNKLISIYSTLSIEEDQLSNILDIEVYFRSINQSGVFPLITCSCGSFGCGGTEVTISKDQDSRIWRINNKEYILTRQEIKTIGMQLIEYILKIKNEYKDYLICSGTYGEDISNNLEEYGSILKDC
ncbi:hypothetical protein SD71_21635 [Cohnella kolymensis]|uniref:Uncharacterized protein n=1 Tax=Cohnella kolymensis TaxID=1590652 RepID=A0ABR4ZZJ2_9BACL|nr:hypothetical protein [Cohnella kolymensis]KIL34239.1 hypothetical protein SD71_21635 [Cohnella kolymensis]